VQILHDFDAGPTADLPRPVGDQPDFTQPIMSEFRTNFWRAVSFSRDRHLLSAPA
jgi:hypothetical protein